MICGHVPISGSDGSLSSNVGSRPGQQSRRTPGIVHVLAFDRVELDVAGIVAAAGELGSGARRSAIGGQRPAPGTSLG